MRILLAALIYVFGTAAARRVWAQGVATGGAATPARPLPAGMMPPEVRYEDIALQAGLFDYDNDGLPDIFLVNGGALMVKERTSPTSATAY